MIFRELIANVKLGISSLKDSSSSILSKESNLLYEMMANNFIYNNNKGGRIIKKHVFF